jgi:tetratricopeptide (TPR) repeat protein
MNTSAPPQNPVVMEITPNRAEKIEENTSANNERQHSPIVEFYIAYHANHDINALESAYEQYKKTTEDEYERQRITAEYYYYRYLLGDHASIPKLLEMEVSCRGNALHWNVVRNIGLCYEEINLTKALNYYSESLEKITHPQLCSKIVVAKAGCLVKRDLNHKNSIDLIKEALLTYTDEESQIILLSGLEKQFEQEKEALGEILTLRKTLAIDGTDNSRKFRLAYAYSNYKYKSFNLLDLSVVQYLSLLKLTPDDSMAHNNLGYAYEQLGLPINAIKSYKRSIELKNTLAASNLGNLLLKAGFIEEAEKVLTEATKEPDCHKSVVSILANIQRYQAAEDARIEGINKVSPAKQAFLEHFADFYLIDKSPTTSIAGKWNNGDEFLQLSISGNDLNGDWTINSAQYSISGEINNATAIFVRKRIAQTWLTIEEDILGFLYISKSQLHICLFMQDSSYNRVFSKVE